VVNLLKDLQPTFNAANLSQGLQQATKLLKLVDPRAASAIYVLSDLQRNSCLNLDAYPIPQQTEVKVVNVGDVYAPNVAVTEVKVEGQVTPKLRIGLGNFSDEDNPQNTLSVVADGQEVLTKAIRFNAGASTNLDILLPALKPGWHSIEARLQAKDASVADNVRYQALFVPQRVRVLLVETRPARRAFEEETFFLAAALDPSVDGTNAIQTGFLFEKTNLADLSRKIPAQSGARAWDVVVLPGLKEVPTGTGKLLATFVQAGGGVAFFLGDGISMNRYNTEFRDLLPAQLDRLDSEPDSSLKWRIGEYETNTAIFAAFAMPNSGNLALAEFSRRVTVTTNAGSRVAASFDDGLPLVVSKTMGQGKVVLVNTSTDTSWTDWPKHKTFVPWLHGLGRHLAGGSNGDPLQTAPASLIAGDDTDVQLELSSRGQMFKLHPPTGNEIAVTADDQGIVRTDLNRPGIYILRSANGREVQRVAVNVPRAESDLAALLPNEFQQQLTRTEAPQNQTLVAGLLGSARSEKEVWRFLLLGALALLFIETLVANRTLA
jgi:hypothetical protein